MIIERAHAKINLYLHITGQRPDGFHTLESLAVFAHHGDDASDHVLVMPGLSFALHLNGPYSNDLAIEDIHSNLISRALRVFAAESDLPLDFMIALTKNLPLASGIGGGSADAAAALRGAAFHHNLPFDHPALIKAAESIGSDGMVCYVNRPSYMRGTGNELERVDGLPSTAMLLVNPNIPLSTAAVYEARRGGFTPPKPLEKRPADVRELVDMLKKRKNDLEIPAMKLCPEIIDVKKALEKTKGCLMARLSGSGATCFGLYANQQERAEAAIAIREAHPYWWVVESGF